MGYKEHRVIESKNGESVGFREEDDKLLLTHFIDKQKLRAHIDMNKREQNAISQKGYRSELRKKNLWRAASIPNWVVMKWRNEEGIDVFKEDHWPKVKEKLNSAEWAYLRTSPGKL